MNREELIFALADRIKAAKGADKPFILAIDGRCAAGKTTLAQELSCLTGAAVVHVDDFFLQPFQRTKARLDTPGENVDWERFKAQVLLPLSRGETARFRPFDCHTLGFKEESFISPENGVIIEGTYCLHKALRDFYSLKVFADIPPQAQRRRIEKRNGKEGAAAFVQKWIPLEESYFSACDPAAICDYVITSE